MPFAKMFLIYYLSLYVPSIVTPSISGINPQANLKPKLLCRYRSISPSPIHTLYSPSRHPLAAKTTTVRTPLASGHRIVELEAYKFYDIHVLSHILWPLHFPSLSTKPITIATTYP